MKDTNNLKTIGKTPDDAISPNHLNNLARRAIENELGNIWVIGEVTNVSANQNLHIYFSLKDVSASVSCAFFKNANFSNIRLKNGENVLVYGQVSLFEKTGNYQIIVKRIEKSGIGDRAKAFAELKVQLESMGYFSQDKKQALPAIINSLAIVTSETSAAITDILNVIKRRNPLLEVTIYHASVQGDNAVEEIIDALLSADIKQHDVILLTRGGGSIDDLWTFNDVSIAQTLFNLSTPCVSAIGHERDTAITDLVADTFAITPTAAAELLTPDMSELKLRLNHNLQSMQHLINQQINNYNQQVDISFHKLEKSHPKTIINNEKSLLLNLQDKLMQLMKYNFQNTQQKLTQYQQSLSYYNFNLAQKETKLNYLKTKLVAINEQNIKDKQEQLRSLSNSLNTLSPLSTLSRGYSITLKQNNTKIITSKDDVNTGDVIETKLKKGSILSQVID